MKRFIFYYLLLILALEGQCLSAQSHIVAGLKMPRLTTEQRDLIQTGGNLYARGQFIYNTDTDCQEYWNGEEWVGLCQGSLNPKVDIPAAACGKIRVYGKYYKNSPLNNTHYITVQVTVTQKGNYTIIATSNNGYYFQTSGVFETTGTFELYLQGMGTPGVERIDRLSFTCNGSQIGLLCDIDVTVGALTMGYQADCDNIQVLGTYQTRRFMDGGNVVKVPVDVLETGAGFVNFETDMMNGIKFSVNQVLASYGADTLILKAQGCPQKAGTYKFTFTTDGSFETTCSFIVNCISTLGTFDEPACKCLDIYDENPFAVNGEYWLQDCEDDGFPIVRTFCDITGGGWTLVWSFSEKTAREVYVQSTATGGTGNSNSMVVSGAYWGVMNDRPTNRITTDADDGGPAEYKINYNNFRLNRNEWLHFPINTSRSQLKVRIADNPTDMNDEWGQNNYGVISPRNENENPIVSTFTSRRVPSAGKVYGKNWEQKTSGGGANGGWDEVSGNHNIGMYNNNTYCTHWNWGGGSSTLFQVTPDRGGAVNTMRMSDCNNMFGWFGETQPNHHFGKCGGVSGDDYSFATRTCAGSSLVPHSFNNGEGRYLQWFVK